MKTAFGSQEMHTRDAMSQQDYWTEEDLHRVFARMNSSQALAPQHNLQPAQLERVRAHVQSIAQEKGEP